jgi:hypothetical protein
MPDHSKSDHRSWSAKRAIVLQLLRNDHSPEWSRAELQNEMSDIDARLVNDAIDALAQRGVAVRDGETVCASSAARCLDELELLTI